MTGKRNSGFIALTSVLIIGAVIIVLGVSMFYASLTDQAISTDYQNSQEAKILADFCLKEGALKLKTDINYMGGEEIEVGDNVCYINLVEDVDGNTKKVSSRGRAGDQPHFATMSEFVHYAIEPGTEGWVEVDDPQNSNVRVVSNFLTLTLSQVVEAGAITDTSDDWNSGILDGVIADNGSLVLVAAAPPSELGENGASCNDGSECQSNNCYIDEDGDRYAPALGAKKCQASPKLGVDGDDCCDSDFNAHKNQADCFSIPRVVCGGYDYNCVSGEEVCVTCPTSDCVTSYGCGVGTVNCYTVVSWTCSPASALTITCR